MSALNSNEQLSQVSIYSMISKKIPDFKKEKMKVFNELQFYRNLI